MHIDYLVGGLRISLSENSHTPGPRSHIINVVDAFRNDQHVVNIHLANQTPGLAPLTRAPEGGGAVFAGSLLKRLAIDAVRVIAAIWSGVWLHFRTLNSSPDVIYERIAVLQNLAAFHSGKSRAIIVVESNGIMSVETAMDRKASALVQLSQAIERRVYRRADVIVAVSESLARAVIEFANIDPAKVLVVPNAIPRDLETAAVAAPPNSFRIGFVGAVVPWQNIEALLRAIAVSSARETLELRVVGDGESVPHLVTLASELGIEHQVKFLGRLPRNAVRDEMTTWSVGYAGHIATNQSEMYHSPLKIYEYAAVGLAIIATDYADSRMLMKTGARVWIAANAREMGVAIDECFAQWQAGDLPSAHAAEAVRQSNTWDARVAEIVQAIHDTLGNRGSCRKTGRAT